MAEFTKNFNLEKPAQTDFYNVDVQNSNMDKIDTVIAAATNNETTTRIDTNVTDIKNKIGATTDTGGTTTAGGIFAKLNAILQQFSSNWTAVRAAKLDQLDVAVSSRADKTTLDNVSTKADDIQSKIGITNAVPSGSATTGSIFAKINWILENWTTTRAEKLDRLDATISSRASAEDLKKINSNLVKPLNTLLEEKASYTLDRIFEINNLVNTLKTGTVPIVKSVQRGTVSDGTQPVAPVTVTINNINVNKSIILVFGMSVGDWYPCGQVLSSTSISISGGGDSSARNQIAWQVIEFY